MRIKKSVLMASHMVGADFMAKLVGIAVLAFYARYLTKDQMALLPIYDMLGAMCTVIFSFGIFPTFVRTLPSLLSTDPGQARALIFMGSGVILVGVAAFAVAAFAFADLLSRAFFRSAEYEGLLQIMSCGFFAVGLRTVANYLLWSAGRFSHMASIQLIQSLMSAALTVGLLLMYGLKGLVLGLVVRDFVVAGLSVFFLRDILFQGAIQYQSPGRLIKSSLPYYLEGYVLYFKEQGDNLIVASFLGPTLMATYYVARRLYGSLLSAFHSIDRVITVGLSGKRQSLAEVEAHLDKVLTAMSQVLIPLVMFCLGLAPAFIYIVAGARYGDAVVPGVILCLVVAVQFTWSPIGRAIFVLRPPLTRFKLSLVEAFSLVVLLAALVPVFRVEGVAAARFVAALSIAVTAYIVATRFLKINAFGRAFWISVGGSMCMASFMLLCQAVKYKAIFVPFYAAGGVLIFIIITSLFNSGPFYAALNSVLPFKVADPIRSVVLMARGRSGC